MPTNPESLHDGKPRKRRRTRRRVSLRPAQSITDIVFAETRTPAVEPCHEPRLELCPHPRGVQEAEGIVPKAGEAEVQQAMEATKPAGIFGKYSPQVLHDPRSRGERGQFS